MGDATRFEGKVAIAGVAAEAVATDLRDLSGFCAVFGDHA